MDSWQQAGDDDEAWGPPRVSLGAFWRVLAMAAMLGLVLGALSLGRGRESGYAASSDSGLFAFGARDGIALTSGYSDGTNPLITWSEIEPEDGVYNWSVLDNLIASASKAGKRIVPRIETNIDGGGVATPDWFFTSPGALYYYPSSGAQSHGYKSPVPWDPTFQQKFGAFLTAMGKRYNGNPTIAFFQTNAGGGMYGEQYMGNAAPGYTASVQIATSKGWLDKWQAAFPSSHLAVMVNYLGGNIGEDVSAYAASKGIFLQQNSPSLSSGSVALFTANANKTRIILEVEDGGCQSATGSKFAAMITKVESYGFPIDYLMVCSQTFGDGGTASTLPSV
ncbi:MAG TPA: beta-galactosidase, partial [Dehalococcoidia bacterium]|nr:beta-galactosidase [Dehalococcoidia bacterium]